MPSFDISCEVELHEVDNAINSSSREITNRFDFKGSKSEISRNEFEITIITEDEVKLKAILDILKTHLTRRKIDPKFIELKAKEAASGNMIRQFIEVRNGIDQENAKKITKKVKESKIKVQAAIQGDKVRISGKKIDDLQTTISNIKEENLDIPLQFGNFRD